MLQFLPMAVGALGGALTNKDPLTGALTGAGLGAATGGLGGLGGAASAGGMGLSSGTSGLGLSAPGVLGTSLAEMGGAQGLAASGSALSGAGATGGAAAGLLSPANMKTMGDMAGLAGKMGLMDSPQGPVAQSAGIPGRSADFTGLLSANRGNQLSGAEKLLAQRNARKG